MNIRRHTKSIMVAIVLSSISGIAHGQSKANEWSLQSCIDYALQQNINIRKNRILLEQDITSTKQAKAQLLPSLSASTSHNINNKPMPENDSITKTSYTGNYGLNASWTIFNGFKRKYDIKQKKLQEESRKMDIANSEFDIKVSIVTYYIQVLYAQENITTTKNSLETSKAQLERGKEMMDAGSISKSDLAQLEAQYYSDKYQLVLAENNLDESRLQIKQLLELDISQEIYIPSITIEETEITQPLPSKEMVYANALSVNPAIKSSQFNKLIAELETKKAKSSYYPTLNLNAGVSTGHSSSSDLNYGEQIKYNFGENIGLSLNYSIFDNRERKSTIEKAKLNEIFSDLEKEEAEKKLLKDIESAYLDAVAAQSKYIAANENLKAVESSYELIEQKYNLGMKNPFELLSEKNTLLNTRLAKLQAKYMALLSLQVLNIYQDMPIQVGQ